MTNMAITRRGFMKAAATATAASGRRWRACPARRG